MLFLLRNLSASLAAFGGKFGTRRSPFRHMPSFFSLLAPYLTASSPANSTPTTPPPAMRIESANDTLRLNSSRDFFLSLSVIADKLFIGWLYEKPVHRIRTSKSITSSFPVGVSISIVSSLLTLTSFPCLKLSFGYALVIFSKECIILSGRSGSTLDLMFVNMCSK